MMDMHKKLAAIGLSAGLLAGGAAGAVLGTSGVSGAEPIAVVQDDSDEAPAEEGGPSRKGRVPLRGTGSARLGRHPDPGTG